VLAPSVTGVLGTALHTPALDSSGQLHVTLHGRSGVYFTTTGDGSVVATAVRAALPAARDGLATGWTVSSIGDKPCKGLPSLQRALTSAEDSGAPPVSVSIAPPSVIINIGEKARRKLQKRGNAAAKKLRATSNAGGGGTDVTTEFYRLAVCLSPSPHHTCTLRCQTKPRWR
jgi:hypothetical protein